MLPELKLTKEDSPKTPEECREMENIPYINAVGSLMYLATMTVEIGLCNLSHGFQID